jgi:hypothetical protein
MDGPTKCAAPFAFYERRLHPAVVPDAYDSILGAVDDGRSRTKTDILSRRYGTFYVDAGGTIDRSAYSDPATEGPRRSVGFGGMPRDGAIGRARASRISSFRNDAPGCIGS